MTAQSAREDAARAATPGPWASDDDGNVFDPSVSPMHDDPRLAMSSVVDARHIALNDPGTILADIEEMQRLRAVVDAAKVAVAEVEAALAEFQQEEQRPLGGSGEYDWNTTSFPIDLRHLVPLRAALKEVSE